MRFCFCCFFFASLLHRIVIVVKDAYNVDSNKMATCQLRPCKVLSGIVDDARSCTCHPLGLNGRFTYLGSLAVDYMLTMRLCCRLDTLEHKHPCPP